MYSSDLTKITLEDKLSTTDQSSVQSKLICIEGLAKDSKALPCFSQYELFEYLTREQRVNRTKIQNKLQALLNYLTKESSTSFNTSLRSILSQKLAKSPSFVKETKVLYDNALMALFAYAFKFRIELFTESNNKLSTQYFGLKDNYAIRLLLTSDSYIILKKKCRKALRLVTRNSNKATASESRLTNDIDVSFEAEDALKLNRDSSSNTRCSSTDQSPNASPTNRFSSEHTVEAKSINSSFCSASKASGKNTKVTGHLKFYNESKEYGFIIMEDQSEIFVHKIDLVKEKIDTRYLAYYKQFYDIVIEFNIQEYKGRGKIHRKAIDLAIKDMVTVAK